MAPISQDLAFLRRRLIPWISQGNISLLKYTQHVFELRQSCKQFIVTHMKEGKQSKTHIQPLQPLEDPMKLNCIVKDGKLRNMSCSSVGGQWLMQRLPFAMCWDLRWWIKMLNSAVGMSDLQQWRWFSCQTWIIKSLSNILMAAQGTWHQTHHFALKLPHFRHCFTISWLRLP